jgi:hypothetical protein
MSRMTATVATLAMLVLATSSAIAASRRFHDPKFDSADLAAEKAEILLESAVCGVEGAKSTKGYEKALAKAIAALVEARASIADAVAAADGAGASQR